MKLKCRASWHNWTKWSEPTINKTKGDFWTYKMLTQAKDCLDCKKVVVREV